MCPWSKGDVTYRHAVAPLGCDIRLACNHSNRKQFASVQKNASSLAWLGKISSRLLYVYS